jgi:hypothetical protein
MMACQTPSRRITAPRQPSPHSLSHVHRLGLITPNNGRAVRRARGERGWTLSVLETVHPTDRCSVPYPGGISDARRRGGGERERLVGWSVGRLGGWAVGRLVGWFVVLQRGQRKVSTIGRNPIWELGIVNECGEWLRRIKKSRVPIAVMHTVYRESDPPSFPLSQLMWPCYSILP